MGDLMPNHIGLALRPNDFGIHDLALTSSGDLELVYGAEAVGQHARQRLMTHSQEWFLDTAAGVPWLSDILGRKYDPALAEAVVKAEIMGTHGVTGTDNFSVSFVRGTRELRIRDVSVTTTYDETVSI